MAKYPLSDRRTDAILEPASTSFTGLERGKIEAEYRAHEVIEELHLGDSEAKLMALIKKSCSR